MPWRNTALSEFLGRKANGGEEQEMVATRLEKMEAGLRTASLTKCNLDQPQGKKGG